jgi:hypothetical protein
VDLAVHVDLARAADLDHVAAQVLDAALAGDPLRPQAPGTADEAEARAGRQDDDVELAVVRIGLHHAAPAPECAADRDDRLPAGTLEPEAAVDPHRRAQRMGGRGGAQGADGIGRGAEPVLERLRRARRNGRQAGAGDVHERPPVGQPSELERSGLRRRYRERGRRERVGGEVMGAREVVRGATRDDRERHAEPPRKLRRRRHGPVAARHDEAVRGPRLDPGEALEHRDLRPMHGRCERLRVEPAAGRGVGGDGDPHGR